MNGHYLAASWQDDMIRFYAYHNLCDSRGFIPWFKTVLYLYLVKTADPSLSRESVNLPGEPFLPNETEDPYQTLELPEDLQPFFEAEPVPVFVPDTRYAQGPGRIDYNVRADGREFTDLVKPHTTKVACFLMPSKDGYPLEVSDYLSTDTILAQNNHAAA